MNKQTAVITIILALLILPLPVLAGELDVQIDYYGCDGFQIKTNEPIEVIIGDDVFTVHSEWLIYWDEYGTAVGESIKFNVSVDGQIVQQHVVVRPSCTTPEPTSNPYPEPNPTPTLSPYPEPMAIDNTGLSVSYSFDLISILAVVLMAVLTAIVFYWKERNVKQSRNM